MQPVTRVLADGSTLVIRDIRPDDADALREGFTHLSAESRHLRFLGGIALTPPLVSYLTNVDGVDHVAIVATRTGADGAEIGVGVARFVRLRSQPTVAEVAITVVDEMQGKGVGRVLAELLGELALARGIEHFRGEVLVDNARVRALLRHMGALLSPIEDGRISFDVPLQAMRAATRPEENRR